MARYDIIISKRPRYDIFIKHGQFLNYLSFSNGLGINSELAGIFCRQCLEIKPTFAMSTELDEDDISAIYKIGGLNSTISLGAKMNGTARTVIVPSRLKVGVNSVLDHIINHMLLNITSPLAIDIAVEASELVNVGDIADSLTLGSMLNDSVRAKKFASGEGRIGISCEMTSGNEVFIWMDKAGFGLGADIDVLAGRFRRLADLDLSKLANYDQVKLGEIDYEER